MASNLRERLRLKLHEVKPFLTYKVFGVDDVLVEKVYNEKTKRNDIYPLCVNIIPPSSAFCVDNKMMTTFLTRHTDIVKPDIKQFQEEQTNANLNKLIDTAAEKVMEKSIEENLKALPELVAIGRNAFRELAETCYYLHEPDDISPVKFFEPQSRDTIQAELEVLEAIDKDILYFPLTFVEEEKFLDVAMSMITTLTGAASLSANIPFLHNTISVDEAKATIQKQEKVSTVDAKKSSGVSPHLRSVAPETK